jgi:hypothetical protein
MIYCKTPHGRQKFFRHCSPFCFFCLVEDRLASGEVPVVVPADQALGFEPRHETEALDCWPQRVGYRGFSLSKKRQDIQRGAISLKSISRS